MKAATNNAPLSTPQDRHYGEIVELAIRKSGMSVTEIARLTNVNRRSVYNWFLQKELKLSIIHRVANVIRYDFSKECPEIFSRQDFETLKEAKQIAVNKAISPEEGVGQLWKERYITLLETYNSFLEAMPQCRDEQEFSA